VAGPERTASVALKAARLGFCLYAPRSDTLDGLQLLRELGGSATIAELAKHTGRPHGRRQLMQRACLGGLVAVRGEARPYRYQLTKAGEALLDLDVQSYEDERATN